METSQPIDEPTVAVVLAGAAARGAFQAGALAALVPALEQQGCSPTLLLGTSAGAINAALWGSWAHEPSAVAANRLVTSWTELGADDVYAPLTRSGWPRSATYLAGALLRRGNGTTSVFDTGPLRDTVATRFDARQLNDNIADDHVDLDAVGVVATRTPPTETGRTTGMSSGRSVLFLHERHPSGYTGDPDSAHDVEHTPIGAEHVIASSAIPIAFPARHIATPPTAAGWYVDGGVRLNAPLRDAIALGATRIVLVSATSTEHGPPLPSGTSAESPDIAAAGAQLLHAILSDRMIDDLDGIRRINHLVAQAEQAGLGSLDRRGEGSYRRIEFMRVSPPPGAMGVLAGGIARHRGDIDGLLDDTDNFLIARALRGVGDERGYRELISYLLFDRDYFRASIDIGRVAAERALEHGWEE